MKDYPLYRQIQSMLRKQIELGNLRPGDRIPSEKELAEQFRVSLITTKNALSGLADEGIVTRIKGKGTFVAGDSALRFLKSETLGSQHTATRATASKAIIGLIIPSMRTSVEQRLLDAIEAAANRHGYSLIVRVSRGSAELERQAIRKLADIGAAGVVMFPIGGKQDRGTIGGLSRDRVPFVLIDRYDPGIPACSVCSDNEAGAFEAVSYMLRQGRPSVALVTPPNHHTVILERIAGYERALIQAGLRIEGQARIVLEYKLFLGAREEAAARLSEWLYKNGGVQAFLAVDVDLARMLAQVLRSVRGEEARHACMATFDDPGLPGVSFIRQNEQAIGEKAVELLMDQIQGRSRCERVVVPVCLVTHEG
jgi:GntR family transcriptional regulator, arabinose operon transcriptional repressor